MASIALVFQTWFVVLKFCFFGLTVTFALHEVERAQDGTYVTDQVTRQ